MVTKEHARSRPATRQPGPGAVTMAVAASPSSFVYISRAADGSIPSELPGCSPSGTSTFAATVVDPPEDVALVTILLSFPPGPGATDAWAGRAAVTSTFILSQTGAFPESTRIFEGTTGPQANTRLHLGRRRGHHHVDRRGHRPRWSHPRHRRSARHPCMSMRAVGSAFCAVHSHR